MLKGKFSKHTLWVNDVLSAPEVQAWETFTPGKASHQITENITHAKDYLSLPQRRLISNLH